MASQEDEVIAVAGVKPPAPWVLLESSTFSGRYYFFNTTTLESQWSLPEKLFNEDNNRIKIDNSDDDSGTTVTDSLFAAQEAVRRMEARYGASPSRPDDDEITSNHLSSSSKSKSSTAFSKRARDLDPRLMSIDLEEQLTNALNKADNIEKSWQSLTIPEEVETSKPLSKSSNKLKTPTNKNKGLVPKSPLIPSAESFKAMSLEEGASFDGDGDDQDGHDGGDDRVGGDSRSEIRRNKSLAHGCADSYVVISGLGSGGYSNVLLVKNDKLKKSNGKNELMAMKVLSKKLLKRPRDRARLRNELRALTEIPPSRFTQCCFSAFETPSHVCFVTEYLQGGDMFFHLTSRVEDDGDASGFTEQEGKILLAEIVLGLIHMHKHKFIHCDIKVENIMLDANGHVKLIDFGLSQEMVDEEEPMSPIGSLIYMAPELLTKSTGGRHTDWWALGVLAHEMLTGRSPWSSLTDKKLIKKQIRNMEIVPPSSLSKEASEFIVDLLIKDWHERLGTKDSYDVKKHAFFNGIDWVKLENGTAPAGFVPPEIAFIQSECDNALTMYQGSDCSDAKWSLGVEEVDSLPPVQKEIKKKPPSKVKPSTVTKVGKSGGGGGGGVKDGREAKDNSPRRPANAINASSGGSLSIKMASFSSSATSSSSSGMMRKGLTPKAPKPKTPRVPLDAPNRRNSKTASATWK